MTVRRPPGPRGCAPRAPRSGRKAPRRRNADPKLRRLERAAAAGDLDARRRLAEARLRAGQWSGLDWLIATQTDFDLAQDRNSGPGGYTPTSVVLENRWRSAELAHLENVALSVIRSWTEVYPTQGTPWQRGRRTRYALGLSPRFRRDHSAWLKTREALEKAYEAQGIDTLRDHQGDLHALEHPGRAQQVRAAQPEYVEWLRSLGGAGGQGRALNPPVRVLAPHVYVSPRERELNADEKKVRLTAIALKTADRKAVLSAAKAMAPLVPKGSVIVPIPSSTPGKHGGNVALAREIAKRVKGRAVTALERVRPVPSSRDRRRAGGLGLAPEQHQASMQQVKALPKGPVVLVDNVVVSGATFEGARRALGGPDAIGVAYARGRELAHNPVKDVGRYLFVHACPSSTAEDIHRLRDSATEITRQTFARKLGPGQWKRIQSELGYDRDFPISRDWHVAYFKGTYRSVPSVFLVWSAFEYIFTLDGKLGPSMGQNPPHDPSLRVVCAWCKEVLQEGPPGAPVSHGICAACLKKVKKKIPKKKNPDPDLRRLERAAAGGDPGARLKLAKHRIRAGKGTPEDWATAIKHDLQEIGDPERLSVHESPHLPGIRPGPHPTLFAISFRVYDHDNGAYALLTVHFDTVRHDHYPVALVDSFDTPTQAALRAATRVARVFTPYFKRVFWYEQ